MDGLWKLPLSNSCEQVKGLWVKMEAITNKGDFSAEVFNGCLTRGSLLIRLFCFRHRECHTHKLSSWWGGFQPPGCLLAKQYSRLQGIQETPGMYWAHPWVQVLDKAARSEPWRTTIPAGRRIWDMKNLSDLKQRLYNLFQVCNMTVLCFLRSAAHN